MQELQSKIIGAFLWKTEYISKKITLIGLSVEAPNREPQKS